MKIIPYILILTTGLFFQKGSETYTESHKIKIQNINNNSDLICKIDIEPKKFVKNQPVQLTFTLENNSSSEITFAKAIAGIELIWFRLKIEDEDGNSILTGMQNESFAVDDLPELIFDTLQSKEKFSVTKRIKIDTGFGMNTYNLKPGKYFFSAVYRFEPEKEPYAAGFYKYEAEKNNIWTGVIFSKPVKIKILSD